MNWLDTIDINTFNDSWKTYDTYFRENIFNCQLIQLKSSK